MQTYERFIKYAKLDTQSCDTADTTPSTKGQFALANLLCNELHAMGVANAEVDEHCYLYAHIAATAGCESLPALGLIAHLDTAPAFSGSGVSPVLHADYNGEDIALPKCGRVIKAADFPFMQSMKGKTVITADGSTLLGADDKAGVAEIMSFCEYIVASDVPHCKLCIAFTPDEEIGAGADLFDVSRFGADFAYTMDGDLVGNIEYENFNAASAIFNIDGVSVHPGSAKNIMVNALSLACEIQSMLPLNEVPEKTADYEGFFHLETLKGDSAKAEMEYIIRDHSKQLFEQKKSLLLEITDIMRNKYPTANIALDLSDSYYNMKEQIAPHMHLIENAKKAVLSLGITPIIKPIRGGTDGARLSYMGLPCPNLGTGGSNFHGPYELICAEDMELATEMLKKLVSLYSTALQ
ncbi:MAG: peptidase T [Oscillospiraceae bacterium]